MLIQQYRILIQEKDNKLNDLNRIIKEKSDEISNKNVLLETSRLEYVENIRQLKREYDLKLGSIEEKADIQLQEAEKERTALYLKIKTAEHEVSVQR